VVTSPRPKVDAGVVFPETALRDRIAEPVDVDLDLVVDAEGHVTKATVVTPRGHGFDEAAIAAAQKIEFEPATRDGRAVAARIKFRYVFTPPPATLVGEVRLQPTDQPVADALITVRDSAQHEQTTHTTTDGKWIMRDLPPGRVQIRVTVQGALPAEADEVLELAEETNVVLRLAPAPLATAAGQAEPEILVKGVRPPREVSKRTLSSDEIRHSAGTQGDALLSIQNLPGIARPAPFSGALVVRGSAPEDTLVLVGGTEVPLAYHFGGLSSVVPTDLVDQIEFYPGNFSSRYGRAMGGMVETQLRAPRADRFHGLAEVSILTMRAMVEGPIAPGWSFFVAGQRSLIDLIGPPLLKAQGETQTALPSWADYQLAVQRDFSADSSLRLTFFGSNDAYDIVNQVPNTTDPATGGALTYHTRFWRLQATFLRQLSSRSRLKVMASYGEDRLAQNVSNLLIDAKLRPFNLRAEFSHELTAGLVANVGIDSVYQPYDFTLQLPPITRPGVPSGGPGQPPVRSSGSKSSFQPGAYAEFEISPWSGGRIVPGLRLDHDSETDHWDISPRINLRQNLTSSFPRTTLKGGAGLYLQPPSPLDTAPGIGQTGLTSNRSSHYDVGFEQEFTRQIELSMDVFYKNFDRLVVPGAQNAGSGSAYGVEWLLRYKPDDRFFGWISYTMSRSERRDVPSEPLTRFQFDQTHVLAIVANYKLGGGWQLGGRFRVTSGDLYTPMTTGAYNASVGSQLGVSEFPPYGARLPTFNQFDIRLEKTRIFSHWRLTTYIDVQNVYGANNPLGLSYNYNYTKSTYTNGLPILPIVGIRGELP
jgi:TonB family protein